MVLGSVTACRFTFNEPFGLCFALLQELPPDAPVVILLPGLTGGSEDSYVQHAVRHARDAGIRAVVFNSRGTSDSPVTTAQFYSASFTEDMRWVVEIESEKKKASHKLVWL